MYMALGDPGDDNNVFSVYRNGETLELRKNGGEGP
jgi:hypothetical protein